jgi:hypothetical protein
MAGIIMDVETMNAKKAFVELKYMVFIGSPPLVSA